MNSNKAAPKGSSEYAMTSTVKILFFAVSQSDVENDTDEAADGVNIQSKSEITVKNTEIRFIITTIIIKKTSPRSI